MLRYLDVATQQQVDARSAQSGATHPFDGVPETDKWVLLTGADYDLHARQDPARDWTVTRRPLVGMSMPTAHIAAKRWSYAPAVKSFVWMASSSSGVIEPRVAGLVREQRHLDAAFTGFWPAPRSAPTAWGWTLPARPMLLLPRTPIRAGSILRLRQAFRMRSAPHLQAASLNCGALATNHCSSIIKIHTISPK